MTTLAVFVCEQNGFWDFKKKDDLHLLQQHFIGVPVVRIRLCGCTNIFFPQFFACILCILSQVKQSLTNEIVHDLIQYNLILSQSAVPYNVPYT